LVLLGIVVGFLRTPPPVPETAPLVNKVIVEPVVDPISEEEAEVSIVSYTVQSGDTLSSIAQMFNTSADSIAYNNNLASLDRISIGWKLSIIQNANGMIVKVEKGDTLANICTKHNVDLDDILKVNHLADADSLSVGQTLLLPGAVPPRGAQILSRSNSLTWPVKGSISSYFGWRTHPVSGAWSYHDGLDIAAASGTSVGAAAGGEVTYVGWSGDYGRLIRISHGDGIETGYGHLSGYAVEKGDRVAAGDVIGYVGSSGNATGPHLHFEVRKNGSPVNPRNYLP